MPSGRTHDRITLWALPVVAGLTLAITRQSGPTLMICGGYLFGGLMLGPDLDIHSVQYKRWGWFRWIWLPYRGSMRHRSPLSHGPITGTTVRVIYLLTWLVFFSFLVAALVNEVGGLDWTWGELAGWWWRQLRAYQREAIAFCIGLELGAFSHYTADWLVSGVKQRWKGRKSRRSKSRRSR